MKIKIMYIRVITLAISIVLVAALAHATASTHIWAPSTDTQAFKTGHVTADVYIPTEKNSDGSRARTITNSGLEFGLLPFKNLTAEAGFDYKTGYGTLDGYPIYLNAKLAVPEEAYGAYFPAIAAGIYDIGTKADRTNNDLVYIELAKTLKMRDLSLGRFSLGYFWGNTVLLRNGDGDRDANGFIWAWERTMTEISDKLWICAEYQGTESVYGAFNLGFSWNFTKNISAICGYQFYNNKFYADTATIQVDINF